ncbi:hypothetical protein K431DRAFT_260325 [Polychaeton citri CBS 116435]|uniref:Uncharacterized protein n=1 Tax=Polychaeton citri CBS 116435 TaxID=1314669 RepID=A0A9P4QIV7_9PEZI|nr:hypothetical protein K431DRAFT_260325 [Polychaeton citri CBS 116435]
MIANRLPILAAVAGFAASESLYKRQDSSNSTCLSYGIDFVDGGNYFINSLSTADFTAVSQFDGCNDDDASILLVEQSTEDEWECTSVPAVPDGVSQLSTCPLEKDQMNSGDWSLLIIGNNGDGNPFAYERDFYLTVAPQQTTTVTPTVTFTATSTPVVNATTTSELDYTSTVNNTLTITEPATTDFVTIVPSEVTTTETDTVWATITRWTATQTVITKTVTPACIVPPRPYWNDPWASITPTLIPLPTGLIIKRGEARAVDYNQAKSRLDRHRAKRAAILSPNVARDIAKRSADAPTLTSTASIAVNTTTTVTADTSTNFFTVYSSNTIYSTLPPITVKYGTEFDTITAPTPTDTVHTAVWSPTVVTETLFLSWTLTTKTTPAALASSCKAEGGHFGRF